MSMNDVESALNDSPMTTLYVGNLDRSVSEQILWEIFSKAFPGRVTKCKIIEDPRSVDPYCFVTFVDNETANSALSFMNGRDILGKKIKVNWATSSGYKKETQGNAHSIFVGDLSSDVDDTTLYKAFHPFGPIVNVRVVRDPATNSSKGYGFVAFKGRVDAETAIAKMQGAILGSKAIRTNWATRSAQNNAGQAEMHQNSQQSLNYVDVYQQSRTSNTTVYIGNLAGSTEDQLRSIFSPFGQISEIRIFPDKGFAFVKYSAHEAATTAIVRCNGIEINGNNVRCWWGKEGGYGESSGHAAAAPMSALAPAPGYFSPYYQFYPYYANPAAGAAPAAGPTPVSPSQGHGSAASQAGYMMVAPNAQPNANPYGNYSYAQGTGYSMQGYGQYHGGM